MKRNVVLGVLLLLLVLAGVANVVFAAAGQQIPKTVEVFYYTDKSGNEWICFNKMLSDGGIDCERMDPCPCASCEESDGIVYWMNNVI